MCSASFRCSRQLTIPMWYNLRDLTDPQEASGILSRAVGMSAVDRKRYVASEIIKKLRQTGLPGPFEVVEADDAEGKLTDQVQVRSHGKNNRDGWAI